MTDLVTFGESMLRLATPDGDRLETAHSLDLHVGGAESNVAAACSHLGVDSAWLSKLPDSPLGRRVTSDVCSHGVAPAVTWSDEGRVGTYYLEDGGEPRGTNVVYDRENAAVRTATADELALDRVREAEVFYVSGITPALSATLAETTADLLRAAREAGTTTVLDVNYRAKLWSPEQARETLTGLLSGVDVLVVARRDAETLFDLTGDPTKVATEFRNEFGHRTVIVTRGEHGATALHEGSVHEQESFPTETYDAVGTGDAFVGGFLARRLQGGSVPEALEWAAATAALKRTIAGDVAVVTPGEVRAVIDEEGDGISR